MTNITITTQYSSFSRSTTTFEITTATKEPASACVEIEFDPDETVYGRVTNVIGDYALLQTWMERGDSLCVDVASQFGPSGIVYDRYVLHSANPEVATVKNNIVTAVGEGSVSIGISFYDKSEELVTFAQFGLLRVLDPSTWIEVRTAEELAAMNRDKTGTYVLKADIDLSGFGEWTPIGGPAMGNQFSGVFINPEGYVISNMRISTASVVPGPYGGLYAGLFGSMVDAYVEGIILEHVYIDVTDYDSLGSSIAGGVVASMLSSVLRDCYVSGYVMAQYFVGGIVGANSWGLLENNTFWGEVHADSDMAPTLDTGVGGIAGYSHTRYPNGGIVDCHAYGIVVGFSHAGGIVGSYVGEWFDHNTFAGSVSGAASSGALIGFDRYAAS
jgi:hypothetical protein